MLNRIDERNLPSFVEKSAKKKDSSFTNGNVPRELIDKVYAIKGKYKDFGSSRIYKLKNNDAAAKFFFDKISKAKESRGGKYGWAVELKSVDSYANKAEDQQKPEEKGNRMRLFILDSGNSGFAIKADGTLVSVFTHKDADKNDINMILAMAVEYGADKLDCYTAKNKLTDLYSKFGFKETGRTAFNHEYAPDDAPDYVKNDEFEGSQLPQNQGRTDLRPTEERPDVAFMHRPQNAPRTGSSILKSKDTNTNYNKKRTTTPSAIGGDYMDEEMKNQEAAAKSKVRGRQTHLQRDWMNQSVSFDTMVKDILGESALTRSIKTVMNESHDEDYLKIVVSDLYEWMMEVGSNSLLDDFLPHQIKAVIEMMIREDDDIPQDDSQMASWCRKNEDNLIENLARATGAYGMTREEFAKKQKEEAKKQAEEDEEDDYEKIAIFNGVWEHLQNIIARRPEFSKYTIKQLKNALTKVLQDETLPPNPNNEGEMYTYARMRIKAIYRILLREEEEEEMPQVIVKGSEILYNKRGRACGVKIQVIDQGTVYMKRKGSHWEITDISQQNDDQKVWDVVTSSLEKMAKKNPTTFIRLMRNRAYELPKFKPTTITESVTLNGIDVTIQDIQNRMADADERIIA